jgi:PAS domain S-box-containing protein
LNADGKVMFCNDALLKTTGYRADEMIGKNLHELLHHSRPDGTTYRAAECGFSRAISAHQAIHVVGESYWRKDGTRFPGECWAHPLSQPIGPTEFVVTFQDLTESLRDKEALRQSQEKFRRILANAPDVAWTSDRNGRVVYIRPKVDAMLGYTTEEIRASGATLWLGLIHPEDFGRVNQSCVPRQIAKARPTQAIFLKLGVIDFAAF